MDSDLLNHRSTRLRFVQVAENMVQTMFRGRSQLWSTGKLRKGRDCCLCGRRIENGERAYIPITHQDNRMDRAHVVCMAKRASKT